MKEKELIKLFQQKAQSSLQEVPSTNSIGVVTLPLLNAQGDSIGLVVFRTKSLTHEKIAFVKEIVEMLQTLVLKIIRTNQGNSEELPTIGIDSYSNETRTFDYEIPVNIGNNELRAIKQNIEKLSLTNREKEVLFLVIKGLSNQDIGDTLFISPHTVKNHITNIYKKLDVADRSQAFALIYQIN